MRASAAAVLESSGGEDLVLEEVRAEAAIDDLLAEVTVVQRYLNPEATHIEAVYTFPLPSDGMLLAFEVEIGERRLAGAVVAKAEAERRYEDAITDGDAAVLLEEAEPGLYTASVGNLAPGETATVRFRYGLLLRWNEDRVRFVMPTTIAPRYGHQTAAGLAPHQIPAYAFDAERSFKLRITLRGLLRDARFNSPSHDIAIASGSEETAIDLIGGSAMDRDFVLEARAARRRVAAALFAQDLDGWVALASFRPEIPGDQRERRCVKLVVDCSGSMGAGGSMAQAREALERILGGLRRDDRFEIMAFGGGQRALFGGEMAVSETSLAQARGFVRGLRADMGGTEIGAALDAAYDIPGEAGLKRDLLLITDGAVWRSEEVIARAKGSGHRIFTIGVGSAVGEASLRSLAEATGGACEFAAPREDMAERVRRHFQRMDTPRATGAVVRWPVPARRSLPDPVGPLYDGDTVHFFAWFAFKPEGTVALEVTLSDGRTVRHVSEALPFEEGAPTNPVADGAPPATLARLAAARRLAGMEDAKAATELAVRYQLMSPWTDYLVIHVRADADKADDIPKLRKIPQVAPADWPGLGALLWGDMLCADGRNYEVVMDAEYEDEDGEEYEDDEDDGVLSLGSAPRAGPISRAELVKILNARPMPPLPILDDLEEWGIPSIVLADLRALVDGGAAEAAVVVAFLHLLAESDAGNALERGTRRQIVRAYKRAAPPQTVMEGATRAFNDWQARSAAG
jgi:Ca-activated chloride channel family protein